MKLLVINEEREPESVAPKIKVFETEADLDEALPDLKDGAIVATKEDESSYTDDNETLLWTNPNPLSATYGMDVSIDNIMQYSKFRITYAYNKDEGVPTAEIIILNNPSKAVDELGNWCVYGWLTTFGGGSSEMNIRKRMVTVYQDSESKIRFSSSSEVRIVSNSLTVGANSETCIPMQIFGIKEV